MSLLYVQFRTESTTSARAITRNEGRFVEVEVEVGSRWSLSENNNVQYCTVQQIKNTGTTQTDRQTDRETGTHTRTQTHRYKWENGDRQAKS